MDGPNLIISMSDLSSHSSNHETDYLDEEYVDLDWQPPQDQKNQINVDQKRSFDDNGSGGRRVTDDVIDDNEVETEEDGSGSHGEGTEPYGKCFYKPIFVVP